MRVLWDGTKTAPWGPYLFVETEQVHAARQRPFRAASQIGDEERQRILADCQMFELGVVARHYRITSTVLDQIRRRGKEQSCAAACE